MDPIAEKLFDYLGDVIYNPAHAFLNTDELPENFRELGDGLRYFAECVIETKTLTQALANGDLTAKSPSQGNEIAAPLKSLQASLKHLTWQTQQVAKGDYQQRVKFMGDFAEAFNSMALQLEERRRQDNKERSKLQQYINLILSNTPSLLLVFDMDEKAVLASESYMRLAKCSSVLDLQGKSFAELFSPFSSDVFLRDIDSMISDAIINRNTATTVQCLNIGQDGSLRSYNIHVTPVLYDNDAVMGTMLVFSDITEITQARREAERARELAEQSARAKSEFMARMTHEMRTPMNAIIGMASIGRSAQDNEKKDYSFNKIADASSHLLGVINDILDMSKIEADKLELSLAEFDFRAMLDAAANSNNRRMAEKRQNFTVCIDSDIPETIVSDGQRLGQVITSLLSNAVKFTPENGDITLTADKVADAGGCCTIRFTVKDTGIGISEEQKKYLFTPFEQVDGGASRKFGGAGLGLSISKNIIRLMGGDIRVESELGKGASFIFDVKVQKGGGAKRDTEIPREPVDERGIFRGKHILIAEDVEINREIIAALLEYTEVEISFAHDGMDAVNLFTSALNPYGAILMDIQMPGMDGFEATRRIRASGLPEAAAIPIIAMTANVFQEDIEQCLQAGMNDHLGKPVDVDEVVAKLKEYL